MITTAEAIRLFVFPIMGLILMFWVQPTFLYQNQMIRLEDVRVEKWLPNGYYQPATLVFACAIFAALLWCIWNGMSPPPTQAAAQRRSVSWWAISLIPIFGLIGGIIWSRKLVLGSTGSDDATLSLIFLFGLDVVFLYWLTTATSTPGLAKYLPPGAGLFRK
jgi:hypothetical protein